jgi:hypothetical protein
VVDGCALDAVTDWEGALSVEDEDEEPDEEEELELDVEGEVELERAEEVPELDAEGDAELELGVEMEEEAEEVAAFGVAFEAAPVVVRACVVRVFAVVDEADLTTLVLPLAISAVSSARPAVVAAAVQRVTRVSRRMPAARARRCRICSSLTNPMEPSGSGTRLPGSCESSVRAVPPLRGRPGYPSSASVCLAAAHFSSRRSSPSSSPPGPPRLRPGPGRST